MPKLRVLHNIAASNGLPVNVFVDDQLILSGVQYKQFSDYLELSKGYYQIKVVPVNILGVELKLNVCLSKCKYYTVIALGSLTSPLNPLQLKLYEDNIKLSSSKYCKGYAKLQFIHGAAGAPGVDVYINNKLLLANITYTQASKYFKTLSGVVSIKVNVAGTETTVVGPLNLNLQPRKVYTVVASGVVGSTDTPLTAVILTTNAKKC